MSIYLEKAEQYKDELIQNRRYLHQNPEFGFNLDNTVRFVMEKLESYGIEPKKVGKAGVTALVGQGEPVILLRGDMDSLSMMETTGYEFASTNGFCHSCAHDTHTSMLLLAAKMLKENEAELKGTVKFMFQPAEEILQGAKDMIENGILENPKVDAAIGIHTFVGSEDSRFRSLTMARGQAMSSADAFKIHVKGKNSHGSTPELGVDAVIVACHIAIALQNVIAREVSMFDQAVILVGKISGGDTVNTTPGHATLEVSTRSNNEELRAFLTKRVEEVSQGVATTFRTTVEIEHTMGAPSMYNNPELVDDIVEFSKELVSEDMVTIRKMIAGTEDFAYVGLNVPAVMINLGAGSIEEGYPIGMHNAGMKLNEDALTLGAATYAHMATEYLKKYSK